MRTETAISAGRMILRGGRPLTGEVALRGAKNSLPKIMVAALLSPERSTLRNVAGIADVQIVSEMIRALGGEVTVGHRVANHHHFQPPPLE